QIPALLNALAAGLIVTRVAREDSGSLASDVLNQLASVRPALVLAGVVSLLLATLGVSSVPFVLLGILFVCLGAYAPSREKENLSGIPSAFDPRLPAVLAFRISSVNPLMGIGEGRYRVAMNAVLQEVFSEHGLILPLPDIVFDETIENGFRLAFRGIPVGEIHHWEGNASSEGHDSAEQALRQLSELFRIFIIEHKSECVDDVFTRRVLDCLERQAPELVAATIPGIISITQLTVLLRDLVVDRIPIMNMDCILQAISENAPHANNLRWMYEEIRISLRRQISSKFFGSGVIKGLRLDPVVDMWATRCERDGHPLNPEVLFRLEQQVLAFTAEEKEDIFVLSSRGSRRLLQDCFRLRGLHHVWVFASEELVNSITWVEEGKLELSGDETSDLMEQIAA
ncbi:MAG: FHIPEP family type III secretion protein, partial [Bdellovibrionales bacterium]|nr:FHIPEP family type III secretion protein [Bdellovibrionales bacterium]